MTRAIKWACVAVIAAVAVAFTVLRFANPDDTSTRIAIDNWWLYPLFFVAMIGALFASR